MDISLTVKSWNKDYKVNNIYDKFMRKLKISSIDEEKILEENDLKNIRIYDLYINKDNSIIFKIKKDISTYDKYVDTGLNNEEFDIYTKNNGDEGAGLMMYGYLYINKKNDVLHTRLNTEILNSIFNNFGIDYESEICTLVDYNEIKKIKKIELTETRSNQMKLFSKSILSGDIARIIDSLSANSAPFVKFSASFKNPIKVDRLTKKLLKKYPENDLDITIKVHGQNDKGNDIIINDINSIKGRKKIHIKVDDNLEKISKEIERTLFK